jgi:hypothetical protein
MWPFDQLQRRRYERRYNAALIVFLGAYIFSRLDAAQKATVEAEMRANLNRSGTPAVAVRKWGSGDFLAACRAAAMERVRVEIPIPGLSWSQLFRPWAFWNKWPRWWPDWLLPRFDGRAGGALLDFRLTDQATDDAKQFLSRSGIDLSAVKMERIGGAV